MTATLCDNGHIAFPSAHLCLKYAKLLKFCRIQSSPEVVMKFSSVVKSPLDKGDASSSSREGRRSFSMVEKRRSSVV
jgi:hypothetical protein